MTPTTFAGRRSVPVRAAAFGTAVCVGLGLATLTALPAAAAPQTIAAVQGAGASTPLSGQEVTITGVVTADYRTGGYNGFYVQTPDADVDGDPSTSEAVFVFLGGLAAGTDIAIGNLVSVTGVAGEFNGLTQVNASGTGASVVVDEVSVPLPTPAPLPADPAVREAHEGMLVAPQGDWLVASSHQLFSFGTLWLNPGELDVKSTELFDAGTAESTALAAQNRAGRLLLDDGFTTRVDNSAYPGTQPYFTTDEVVRNGDAVTFPEGGMVLGWGFDDWRLQPTLPASSTQNPTGVEFETRNARPTAAPTVGGDVTVAAYNVLNYFTTLTSDNGNARGADTLEELEIQESKIVAAINALDADVVALQEIENSVKLGEATDEALQALVAALNDAAGAGTWDYVRTPAPLTDAAIVDFISNAIIFKPGAVSPVGESFTEVDETVWDIAREPIAQTFEADGLEFTVVSNHFKSKSGSGTQPADGQGFFNAERVEQATALKDFVEAIPGEAGENVLLMGDFNAYSEEDPTQVFTGEGWSDLVADRTDGQYTYTFDGELGSLDHAIASPGIQDRVTGVGVWTINSPEWSDRQYAFGAAEAGTVFRSSDHDPVVVGLSTAAEPAVEIDIVTINDFHGRLEANGDAAGAAVLGGLVDDVRAANPNTLFASAGDSVGASTFTSFIQDDEPTLDALNAMGLDVTAIGNHEFDKGRADLDDRIIPNSDFPYLAANVYEAGTATPAYDEYFVTEVDGIEVGFIGALTQDMPELVSPAGIASLEFGDIAEATNRVAAQLRDGDDANGEADVLILLVHEGASSADLAAATDASVFGDIVNGVNGNVDAVVSSHTHFEYDHEIPVPGTDRIMPVIQGGQYGEAYGKLDLSVDPTTKELLSIEAAVLPLLGAAEPNAEVAQIVADAVEFAAEAGNESLGDIDADIRRAVTSTGGENRGGESVLGNLVADAQLWATQDLGTEVAIMNPGGLRADLLFESTGDIDPDGNVTFREAANVQPFANTLVTMDLTGAQLRQVLEEQWQPEGASRPFLKLGLSDSLDYTYDPAAAVGERISTVLLNGEVVTDDQVISIVTNSFLSSGGDNFFTLADGTNRADSGRIDLEAFVDYFAEFTPVSLDPAQRAVGVSVNGGLTPAAVDTTVYQPGDEITLDLSSLLFSNAGVLDSEVVVTLGGVEVGRSVIDPTIVDGTDEVGRASVTFTVPANLFGAQELVITVPDNGTEAIESITLAAAPGAGGGAGGGDGAAGGDGELALTGAQPMLAALLALALLAAGWLLIGAGALRRRAS